MIRPDKVCPGCSTTFTPRSGGVKFCQNVCRVRTLQERRHLAREAASAAPDKLCTRCSERKPKAEFHADARRFDGRFPYCNECRRAYNGSKAMTKDPRTKRQYDADRRAAMSAAERSERARRSRLMRQYRMTPEEYARLLEQQGGVCAICRQAEITSSSKYGNAAWLAVDHDHACCPGKGSCGRCIRGLLCLSCNTAVGLLREDPEIVQAVLTYITTSQAAHADCNLRKGGVVGWVPPYRRTA